MMKTANSIIGVFDRVRSGIRYYSLQLHREIGGEKIDMSSFYVKYKGKRDNFRSSDRRLGFLRPLLIPRGDTVYVNVYDSRLLFAALPTLFASKFLGKRIIGIIHNTRPEKKRFIYFKEKSIFNHMVPYWVFDAFMIHRKQTLPTSKPVIHRKLSIYHEKVRLSKKECRRLLNLHPTEKITLILGYIRKDKNIEGFVKKFLKNAGRREKLLIAGSMWDDITLPPDRRIEMREENFTDEMIGMYIKAADRVAVPYCREESAVAYLAKLYKKKVVG
jgi:hypothetical protein